MQRVFKENMNIFFAFLKIRSSIFAHVIRFADVLIDKSLNSFAWEFLSLHLRLLLPTFLLIMGLRRFVKVEQQLAVAVCLSARRQQTHRLVKISRASHMTRSALGVGMESSQSWRWGGNVWDSPSKKNNSIGRKFGRQKWRMDTFQWQTPSSGRRRYHLLFNHKLLLGGSELEGWLVKRQKMDIKKKNRTMIVIYCCHDNFKVIRAWICIVAVGLHVHVGAKRK